MTPRRGTAADVDALLALWSVARTSHAVTADSRASILAVLSRSAIFVVDGDGGLAGAVVAGWDGWRGNLYRLAVAPAHRRSGVASALVEAGEAWLVAQGAQRLSILVAFEDGDARAFWGSVGFSADTVIGRMVRDLDSVP